MPTRTHLGAVARELRRQLNGHAFKTLPRTQITDLLRKISNEPTTRIKSGLAAELKDALITQGVLVYPSLEDTTTGDTVRIYHAGSVLAELIDTITHPDPGTDRDLGDVIAKVKGKWKWATESGPAASPDPAEGGSQAAAG
jgi:hypothetical protein